MLHVQPTAISPETTTDCIPKWSLEQDHHHHDPNDNTTEQDPVPPPPLTEDDEYFFLNQPPPPIPPCMLLSQQGLYPDNQVNDDQDDDFYPHDDHGMMAMMDDKYETATRIFYATMQKFAGPSSHRRTFLESWHLHSMYSKSQQILLGIPHAQSMVYLSGDDFMFTPQLVPQDTTVMMDQMEFDWEQEEEEEDALPPMVEQEPPPPPPPPPPKENDMMVMSAPAPVMDENLWMAPDKDVSGISSDAVDLYRNGSPCPPSLPVELDSNEKGKATLRSPIQKQENATVTTTPLEEKERDHDDDIPQSSYGTVMTTTQQRDILVQPSPNGSFPVNDITERLLQWPILNASERLAHDLLLAFELAEDFVDNNKKGLRTVSSFFVYLIRIWHVLFVCAEMILGGLGNMTPQRQRRRSLMNDELV
ncbi:hypothetical protein K492DRAFT_177033 [Lichtheimia hyalospora FSU 10163]|nr:hypothetical protein K492DRAFT_177033 [Lichtheimia hyalospora FSU 10163]